jgi:hypothetical protein
VQHESFYACPAQGCSDYVVRLNDTTYIPDKSECTYPYNDVDPHKTDGAQYQQEPPANQNLLAYVGGDLKGKPVVACKEPTGLTGFDHSVPFTDATCATRVDQAKLCP